MARLVTVLQGRKIVYRGRSRARPQLRDGNTTVLTEGHLLLLRLSKDHGGLGGGVAALEVFSRSALHSFRAEGRERIGNEGWDGYDKDRVPRRLQPTLTYEDGTPGGGELTLDTGKRRGASNDLATKAQAVLISALLDDLD